MLRAYVSSGACAVPVPETRPPQPAAPARGRAVDPGPRWPRKGTLCASPAVTGGVRVAVCDVCDCECGQPNVSRTWSTLWSSLASLDSTLLRLAIAYWTSWMEDASSRCVSSLDARRVRAERGSRRDRFAFALRFPFSRFRYRYRLSFFIQSTHRNPMYSLSFL